MEKQWMLKSIGIMLIASCSVLAQAKSHTTDSPHQLEAKAESPILGHETVLQFGGSEQEALELAARVPKGRVVGLDIRKSQNAPPHLGNLSFETSKTQDFQSVNRFDRIYIKDTFTQNTKQLTLLQRLTAKLKPGGSVVMLLPNYKEGRTARALKDTWLGIHEHATTSPSYVLYTPNHYQRMLEKTGLKVERSQNLVTKKEFENLDQFKSWLRSDWGYYQDVSKNDKEIFLQVFIGNYLDETKQSPLGKIVWFEDMLSMEAKKFA